MKDKHDLLTPLLDMLNELKPLTNELTNSLIDSFELKDISKKTILLHEGNVCTYIWFIVEGLIRSYHTIGDKEITSRIMHTNYIAIAPGSFFTQTAATESIETIEDCTLGVLSFAALQKLFTQFPEFNYHNRLLTEQYFYKLEQRLYMLRKHDAAAKYDYFLENYATYSKNIPQKYIASFLNIAPETLSRIRNKARIPK
jgi:CRP/FNR family transcriptional regulator, anaerobic regulatory protein